MKKEIKRSLSGSFSTFVASLLANSVLKSKHMESLRAKLHKFIVKWSPVWFCIPGLLIVGLGVVALVAPRFIVLATAGALMVCGGLLVIVGLKLYRLKRNLELLFKTLEARIVVHTQANRQFVEQQGVESVEFDKKIIYH